MAGIEGTILAQSKVSRINTDLSRFHLGVYPTADLDV